MPVKQLRSFARLVVLVTAAAMPFSAEAQVDPDRVSIELIQQPSWAGELWPADFNLDGLTDLTFLTTPPNGSALVTARGRGDGTFDAPQLVATGTGTPIGVGDVNRDGLVDIVTGTHIVPGRGDGTFDAPVRYTTAFNAHSGPAQVLDMNADGLPDLVLQDHTVVPGNGDFSFATPVAVRSGFEWESMIVVDLNGDALPDIASTTGVLGGGAVDLFFNTGNFIFTMTRIPLPKRGGGVTARDMNGDGLIDLVVGMGDTTFYSPIGALVWTTGQVSLFPGLGGGEFGAPLTFPTLQGPIRVVVGDFNGDGVPDVATGNQTRNGRCENFNLQWASVSVLLGRGDGSLAPASSFALGSTLTSPDSSYSGMQRLHSSDLNGDGRADLITSATQGGAGALLLLGPPTENQSPVANAGPDRVGPLDFFTYNNRLFGGATDPDRDWLTFEWRDASGRVIGDTALSCLPDRQYQGPQDFTLTVRDGRGGEHADTMRWTVLASNNSPIPTGFTGENIGTVGTPGSNVYNTGLFIVSGSGADIWGTADAFRFVHTPASGDFDVVAQLWNLSNVDPWTKGGLMIRERLTAGSRHAFVFATPTTVNGLAFQRREIENEESLHTSGPALRAPAWLRLERRGDTISAYYRILETDPWTLIGIQILSGLTDSVYVGMAVTSHRNGMNASADFLNFAVTPSSTTPPIAWQTTDVGSVGTAGDVQFDGATYTVRGSGADVWDNVDAFRFAYVRASGDGVMTVHVASLIGPHEWSKAGLMIRQSLTADSAHHYLLASEANGLAYQRRVVTGDLSQHTALGGATPVWFRIERSGGTIRLSYSTEIGPPSAWQPIADTPFPAGEAFIGLAVTSHADGMLATGSFDRVSHTFASSIDWTSADIGAVGIAGSDAFDGATHTLAASGTDVWGTVDAFHYKYQILPRNGSIVARVASLNGVDPWTKAGVMIRLSTDPSSPQAFVLLSRDHGVAFQQRNVSGAITTHISGPVADAPVWLRLTMNNSLVTATFSLDGLNWTTLGSAVINSVGGPVRVGLALTSHDNAALATATFDNVTITPSP